MQLPHRIVLSTLTLLLVLPVLAGLVVYTQPSLLRSPLESLVGHFTGLRLKIDGEFLLTPTLSPLLTVGDVSLINPELPDHPPLASIRNLKLGLELLPLLDGHIRIPLLKLQGAFIHLERDASGKANWQVGQTGPGAPNSTNKVRIPIVWELQVTDLDFTYLQPEREPIHEIIKTATASISPESGIQAHIESILDGNPYVLDVYSDMESIVNTPDRPFPVLATLDGKEGELKIDGTVGWPLHSGDTSLEIHLQGQNLPLLGGLFAMNWPDLGNFSLRTRFRGNDQAMAVEGLSVNLGNSLLTGDISYRRETPRPYLDINLALNHFVVGQLGRKTEPRVETETSGAIPEIGTDWQVLNELDGRLAVDIGLLGYRGEEFKDLQLRADLNAGKLSVNLTPLAAFSRRLAGQLLLNGSTPEPTYRLQASSKGLRIHDLVRFISGSTPVSGQLQQVQLDISGALGTGALLEAVDALEMSASGFKLRKKTDQGGMTRLSLKKAQVSLDPKSGNLHLEGLGALDGQPLTLNLQTGTLRELSSSARQPLTLKLTTGNTRLVASGHTSNKGGKVDYQFDLNASADTLEQTGHLLLMDLPPVGPVSLKTKVTGNERDLNWTDLDLGIGENHLASNGSMRFPKHGLVYSARAKLTSPDYELLISALLPGFPHLGNVVLDMDLKGDDRKLDLKVLQASAGQSRATGEAHLDFSGAKPKLSLQVDADPVQLTTVFEKDAPADPPPPATGPERRVIPDIIINAKPLRLIDLDFKMVVRNLLHGQNNLGAYTLSGIIRNSVFKMDTRFSSAYLQKATLSTKISGKGAKPEISVNLECQDLDHGGLLKALGVSDNVTGKLDIQFDARGRGSDLQELLAATDGELKISGGPGKIRYAQLRLWGGNLMNLLIPASISGQDVSLVNCLAGRYKLEPGLFSSEGFVMDTDTATIAGKLEIALPSEKLAGGIKPQPKGVRLFTIDTPIRFGGTLANPTVEPVSDENLLMVGKLAAGAYNPTFLIALFGSVGTGVDNPCEAVLSGAWPKEQQPPEREPLKKSVRGLDNVGKSVKDLITLPFGKLLKKQAENAPPADQPTPRQQKPREHQFPDGN
ncbi:MAG: AsmA family protein [Gammaproteobacteria bacterium]|nr:AsmA family protein [Gammaproteobacteria bacterium]